MAGKQSSKKNKKNGAADQNATAAQSVNAINVVNEVNAAQEHNMTQITNALPERTVSKLPQIILDAIQNGHIAHDVEQVTIRAAKSPTKRDESLDFDALYALDAEGMALLCGGKIEAETPKPDGKDTRTPEQARKGACDHFNYGRILTVRADVRTDLINNLMGPEKTIEKLIKAGLDGGMYEDRAEAREAVVAALKRKGKLDPTYDTPEYKAPVMVAEEAEEEEQTA